MSMTTAAIPDPGRPQDRLIAGQGTTAAQWRAWTGWPGLRVATADELVPPGHRLVVVAPHPDDEVLGPAACSPRPRTRAASSCSWR